MTAGRSNYGSMQSDYRDDPYRDPNQYDSELNKIRGKVSDIRSSVTKLENLFREMNTVGGGTKDVRSRILALETKINETIDSTNFLLRNLNNYRINDRILKSKADKIRRDLDSSIRKYRDLTRAISEMMKTIKTINAEEGVLVDTGDTASLPAQDQLNIEADLALQLEQEQEIQRLADDIVNIEDMFRDLQGQVVEQGEAVDSIADNVDQANYNVEDANQQLGRAVEYKRKVRRRCICIIVLVLVILAVLGLIIGLSVKK